MLGYKQETRILLLNFISIFNVLNVITGFLWISFINSSGLVTISNFTYRVFTILISFFSIFVSIKRRVFSSPKHSRILVYYYIFILFYFSRILIDSLLYDYYMTVFDEGIWIFLLMTLAYIFIEPISTMSIEKVSKFSISNSLYFFFSLPIVLNVVLNTGFSITPTIERESPFVGIGINNLGFLVAISLNFALLNIIYKIGTRIQLFYHIIVLVVSIYILGISGTKSGFITTLFLLVIFILNSSIKKLRFIFLSMFFLGLLAYLTHNIWWKWIELYFKLFEQLISDGDEARQFIWFNALDMFIQSPIFGSAFVIPNSGFFHNFFLDAFVSTGILGGFCFVLYLIFIIRISLRSIKKHPEKSFIPIALLTTFIAGMFSSNLFSNWLFWSFSLLVLVEDNSLNTQRKKIK